MENKISLCDFLIKYTSIPQKIIKNHLKFYDMCKNNPYGILIYEVIEYLKINKNEAFIKRFRENFEEGVDYIKITKKCFSKKGVHETLYQS